MWVGDLDLSVYLRNEAGLTVGLKDSTSRLSTVVTCSESLDNFCQVRSVKDLGVRKCCIQSQLALAFSSCIWRIVEQERDGQDMFSPTKGERKSIYRYR